MEHLGTGRLETERLLLRRFTLQDAAAMYDNWAKDPDVTKYLMWPPHASAEVSRNILTDWVAQYDNKDYYQWAIVPKNSGGEPIGSIAVVHQDDRARMAHIGYCVGREWWNKGITSEALAAVIAFLFDRVGVNRIESRHDPRNPASGKVMMKCALTFEGTHKESDWNNQGICDASYYALLARDYNRTK